ncbi:quinol:electron acceptor oxidoreductase subunit ActD [Methylobacterium brachiatum]|uniref:quinol:electron acceptor oxidoreductase subunit ActD n=1 Tax=Methylobacterium brachiatum TaxID=269660 RepID=UPI0008E0F4FB|nr:quinol:electron acceptor oxidoreductase subunit ActD [Methylobacterium brachiatum]SFI99762.1 Ni/Fe-hydrogenase 2 integral membrane subunit HybB [Methylobacterium brachiatum]
MSGALFGGQPAGPLIGPEETLQGIGGAVAAIPLTHPRNRRWWIAFAGAVALLGVFGFTLGYLLYAGPGVWANNNAVVWALDIASYDWWIGVASGSLLVSAVLLLLGAEWRGAVNRIAETLALLATASAGLYPIIHLGRPWFFFWNLPYPNTYNLWPQFRSPLLWDAIDIVAFLVICVSLWFIGMLPDLATLRDRAFVEAMRQSDAKARTRKLALLRAQIYGIVASGWRGSAAHWQIWVQAYRTVALLGVLLVVSVQTGASVMLAGSLMPGWHSTLLPVSFLVNAVYSGVGVTAAIVVLIRIVYGLDALVSVRHLDVLGRLLLCLGCASAYCYAAEYFDTFLNGDPEARGVLVRRMTGDHALVSWTAILGLVLPAQVLWSARARTAPLVLAAVGLLVAAGAYADHVMVLVVTLTQDFLPSSRLPYGPDPWGIATFAGSLGLFLTLLLLFLRYLPAVSIIESRRLALARAPGTEAAAREAASRATLRPEENPGPAPLWGVSATFASQSDLAAALQAVSSISPPDQVHLDGHGPVPMPRTLRALGLEGRSILPYALAGALLGGAGFYAMCVYATAYDYVFLIGGRPRLSWPSFVVPSISFAMMTGCIAIHLALLVLNRLPRLNHPAFNIPGFLRASDDRFFLSAEARGDRFDAARFERRLTGLPVEAGRPLEIRRIPR